MMENRIKMDDLGVPLLLESPTSVQPSLPTCSALSPQDVPSTRDSSLRLFQSMGRRKRGPPDLGEVGGRSVGQHIPSRELTYPTLDKKKIIFKMTFFGGYVSSLEGITVMKKLHL